MTGPALLLSVSAVGNAWRCCPLPRRRCELTRQDVKTLSLISPTCWWAAELGFVFKKQKNKDGHSACTLALLHLWWYTKRGENMKNRTRGKAVQIYMWPKRGWESLIWLLIVIVLWKIQISSQSSTDTEIWSDKSWVINFFHQKQGAASQLSTSSCQLWVDEAVIWCEGWQGRGMSVQWVRHRGSAPAFGVVPWRGMGEVGGQELEKIIKCLHCFI